MKFNNQNNSPELLQVPQSPLQIIAFAITVLIISAFVALLPPDSIGLLAVLLIGAPAGLLVISRKWRSFAIVILLCFVPMTGILKAVTGSRFAPFTFDIALLLACGLHIVDGLLRSKLRFGKLDWMLAVLWIVAFIQMWNPNVPGLQAGVEGFRKFIFMSVAYYIGRHVLAEKDRALFRKLLSICALLISLYGVKQFFIMSPVDYRMIDLATASSITYLMGGWIRPFSTLPGPFHLGLYLLATSLLTCLMILHSRKKSLWRFLLLAFLVLQTAVLIMTRTKGNWVGFVVGVFIILAYESKSLSRRFIRILGFAAVIALIVIMMVGFSSGIISKVLSEAVLAVTNPLASPTFIFRMRLWEGEVVPAILSKPFFGFGTSSAGEGLQNLYEGTDSLYFFSHNLYLKVWLEMGIGGLLLFIAIVYTSIKRGRKSLTWLKKNGDGFQHQEYQWALGVVVSFLVAGLVIPTLDAYPANYYFWLLLGVLSRKLNQGAIKS